MKLPCERDFSLKEARRRILAEYADLRLSFEESTYGKVLRTCFVSLRDGDGIPVSRGAGKGDAETAFVGGLHEALEHYITDRFDTFGDLELVPVRQLLDLPVNQILNEILLQQPHATMACRRCRTGTGDERYFPLALSVPLYAASPLPGDSFDYSALRRYSSNSGTAIGSNASEATLHALNECIERHDLSRFLATHFLHDRDERLRQVDRPAVSAANLAAWRSAEEEIGAPVTVLDIATTGACATYLAFADNRSPMPRLFGSGSSGFPAHAIGRALSELVQLHLVQKVNCEAEEQQRNAVRHLQRWPKLLRCLMCDLPGLLERRPIVRQAVPPAPDEHLPSSVQVEKVKAALEEQRLLFLTTTLHSSERCCVTQVVVPAFDRFYLVASGNVVLPSFAQDAGHD
ncbi:YcaO-like family protein [Nitratireductor sp. GCM10026969]|uniref:YcaO-like family protein n=1 Tax=Nitratireductor sp. GCM10026969 TaxID=3252645 RepID=UPI00361AB85E